MIRDTAAQDQLIERKSGWRRWWRLGVVALVLVIAAVAGLPTLGRLFSATASVSSSRLAFGTVSQGSFVRDIAAEGQVVAANSPTLYASYGGAVVLKVRAGDRVSKGEVLASIDSPELSNKLAQEQSNADAAKVAWLQAQVDARQKRSDQQNTYDNALLERNGAARDLKRTQLALDAGAVTQQQVDQAQDALDKAKNSLAQAKADQGLGENSLSFNIQAKKLAYEHEVLMVQDLQRQVENLAVRSPVDGQVGQLFIAPSATVAKDAQLLSVIDLKALEVQMQVPESLARDLGIGMSGVISGNGQTWNGLVSAISPEVVNGEVAARLRFVGQAPDQLRQNQRLSVRVLLDHRENVVTVPRGSFVDELGGAFAYVVHDRLATRVPVRLGASSIDKVEVLDGLKPGDKVVISGTDNFNNAASVAISD